MSSIVFCLLLSCFTFHLGFVHPLQDVAFHQCLPLSSVCCFPVSPFTLAFVHPLLDVALPQCLPICRLSVAFLFHMVPSFLVMSSCHLLLGRPLDLFPSPWLPLCAAFGPPIVLHSCCTSDPSPLLFQCVLNHIPKTPLA